MLPSSSFAKDNSRNQITHGLTCRGKKKLQTSEHQQEIQHQFAKSQQVSRRHFMQGDLPELLQIYHLRKLNET